MNEFSDRCNDYNGCLYGFVVGDALGSFLEFSDRDTLYKITEMETNYLYDLPAGSWTRTTSQLLLTADHLNQWKTVQPHHFLLQYHALITRGQYLIKKNIFEPTSFMRISALKIGLLLKSRKPLPEILNPLAYHQNDCEPLLRVAPVVICHYHHPDLCLHQIEQLTQTTHVSTECVDACRYFASLLIGVLMGVEKQQLLSATFNLMDVSTYGPLRYNRFSQSYLQHCSETQIRKDPSQEAIICQSAKTQHFLRSLYPSVLKVQKGSFLHKSRNEILSDDSLIHCLEAALWAFSNGDTFEEGCINAINLGGNSTGIGAIYGQLAGAYYGYQQIPNRWISKIQHMEILQDFLIPITKIANENLR